MSSVCRVPCLLLILAAYSFWGCAKQQADRESEPTDKTAGQQVANEESDTTSQSDNARLTKLPATRPAQQAIDPVQAIKTTVAQEPVSKPIVRFRAVLSNTDHSPTAVAFSPDGRLLATASYDTVVTLWDLKSGSVVGSLKGHRTGLATAIADMQFSPDGSTLASAGEDGVIVWDVKEQRPRQRFLKSEWIQAIAYSPDGRSLAMTGNSDDFWVYDLKDEKARFPARNFNSGTEHVLAYSPDNKTVAIAADEDRVLLVDANSGEVTKTLAGHKDSIYGLAFSPDGALLMSCGFDDHQVIFWDVATGNAKHTIDTRYGLLTCAAYSAGGEYAVTGGASVSVWDPATGTEFCEIDAMRGNSNDVAISSDGRLIAVASNDETGTYLFDVDSRRERFSLAVESVDDVAISSDGKLCAYREGYGKPIMLKQTETGDEVASIAQESDSTFSFSPDGKLLAVTHDETVNLHSSTDGKLVREIESDSVDASSPLAWSPAGELLAACEYSDVEIWDARSGERRAKFESRHDDVTAITFSPDSSVVALGTEAGFLELWNLKSQQLTYVTLAAEGEVTHLSFTSDGKWIAIRGEGDATVSIVGISNDEVMRSVKVRNSRRASERGTTVGLAFHPDGKLLMAAGSDGLMSVWDVESMRMSNVLPITMRDVRQVRATVDGQWIVVADDKKIMGFNAEDFVKPAASMDSPIVRSRNPWLPSGPSGFSLPTAVLEGHREFVQDVEYSRDGRLIASAGDDQQIIIWNADTGEMIRALKGHSGRVLSVAFSSDAKRLVSGSDDNTVRLWDVESGEMLKVLGTHKELIRGVAYSPDDKWIVSAGGAGFEAQLIIWNAQTGREHHEVKVDTNVESVEFLPDGNAFAAALFNGEVQIIDPLTGKRRQAFKANRCVNAVAFTKDSKKMAGCCGFHGDSPVFVWDLEGGRQLHELKGHRNEIDDVAISPDGKLLASVSHGAWVNGLMIFWDMETGRQLRQFFPIHDNGANAVEFAPDGKTLATGAADYVIKLWDVNELRSEPLQSAAGKLAEAGATFERDGGRLVIKMSIDGRQSTAALFELKNIDRPYNLDIEYSSSVTDAALSALAGDTNLRSLTFSSLNYATDEGAAHLATLENVESLKIESAGQLTPASIESIAQMKSLRRLEIEGIELWEDEFSHLAKLQQLESLRVDSDRLTAKSIENLQQTPQLAELAILGDWDDNAVTAAAKLKSLRKLTLEYTGSATALATLRDLPNLEELYLSGDIDDEGLEQIGNLNKLKSLVLSYPDVSTDEGLKHLTTLTELESLKLEGDLLDQDGLKHLATLPNLKHLDVSSTRLQDAQVAQIAGMKNLQSLLLPSQITDAGFLHLADLASLESVNWKDLEVKGPGLAGLRGTQVTELDFGWNSITDEQLAGIKDLTQLRSLTLPDDITDKGMPHLAGLVNLTKLVLEDTNITDAGLAHLKNLKQLQELDLSSTKISKASLELLKQFPQLQVLDVTGTDIDAEQREQLRKDLPDVYVPLY